jgi:hypothetical protein
MDDSDLIKLKGYAGFNLVHRLGDGRVMFYENEDVFSI